MLHTLKMCSPADIFAKSENISKILEYLTDIEVFESNGSFFFAHWNDSHSPLRNDVSLHDYPARSSDSLPRQI